MSEDRESELITGRIRHLLPLALVVLAALSGPPPARARTVLVGVIMSGNTPYYQELHKGFAETITSRFDPAGGDLQILVQRPFPDPVALSNAARKLVASEVDIIVAYGSSAARAVLNEKSRIPLVYGGVYDPSAADLAGPNVTGCGFKIPLSSLVRYLRALKSVAKLDVIYSDLDDDSTRQVEELASVLENQKIVIHRINLRNDRDLEYLRDQARGDAAFITGCGAVDARLEEVLARLKANMQPSVSTFPDIHDAGVTIALYQHPREQGQKTAGMALKVLAGARPGTLKPEVLRNTELVFNLQETRDLGLKIPFELLTEATQVKK